MNSATRGNVGKFLSKNVDVANSVLHTDESKSYMESGKRFQAHATVNHRDGEYVRGNVSTNQAEDSSLSSRSIDGTHHHLSPEHLHRYVNEFAFQRSTCKRSDPVRLQAIGDQGCGTAAELQAIDGRMMQDQADAARCWAILPSVSTAS